MDEHVHSYGPSGMCRCGKSLHPSPPDGPGDFIRSSPLPAKALNWTEGQHGSYVVGLLNSASKNLPERYAALGRILRTANPSDVYILMSGKQPTRGFDNER